MALGRRRGHGRSTRGDLRGSGPPGAHRESRTLGHVSRTTRVRHIRTLEGREGGSGGRVAHRDAAEEVFPLVSLPLDPLVRELHLLRVPPGHLRLLPFKLRLFPLLRFKNCSQLAILLHSGVLVVLVDAPLGHHRAGPRGRRRGVRAELARAPVRRVLSGMLRLRHVHLLHLVLQRRRNLRWRLTLPEGTRGLLRGRRGHAHGRGALRPHRGLLGRRMRPNRRRGHDSGWSLRLRRRHLLLLLLLGNLERLHLHRHLGHRRGRPRGRVAGRGRARVGS